MKWLSTKSEDWLSAIPWTVLWFKSIFGIEFLMRFEEVFKKFGFQFVLKIQLLLVISATFKWRSILKKIWAHVFGIIAEKGQLLARTGSSHVSLSTLFKVSFYSMFSLLQHDKRSKFSRLYRLNSKNPQNVSRSKGKKIKALVQFSLIALSSKNIRRDFPSDIPMWMKCLVF